ncbi:uncharacterized protein LOC658131 isoform X1 [Tribolium castaneum]|nr:PREDICTED: DNA ligase 1 isoform X1 [Tribolium castaneum]XP_008194892.1 PREDICTED: DNA ligase 1 isoform X1 [Tribolium castaneum]|eukprot:XP_001809098.1 PREDICTED: DNA ligase 1 isoform X1 [Tribolium castaneum]
MVFTKAMPSGNDSEASGSNPAARKTFRPPWVKEGPNPLPVPPAPWTLKNTRRDSTKETPSENPLAGVQLRKTSVTTKEPQENGKENTFKRPQLRPVPPKEETKPPKETLPPVKLNSVTERQKNEAKKPLQKSPSRDEEIDRVTPVTRNALVREQSMRKLSQTPAPPPMPPPAPAMPGAKKNLTSKQKEQLEQLKSRPKVRPDWTAMLKEIESNKKLKHVECNDRSQPLLPKTKATEHFVFESEKDNVHNELLKQIQDGIRLKKVKTNDRSKPMLEGLRKFRRQMTIEEQIQKSVSMASMPPEEIEDEVDEMDDIDKVRDDLQSTKQMLALELRNKEAQIRENKRLLARIQNLEAELEKERNRDKSTNTSDKSSDEKLIQSLRKESEQARKTSEEVEKKFAEATEQLDNTRFQLEEQKKQNQILEKKLQEALQGKRTSISKDMVNGEESEDECFADEESEESDGEDTEEKREKRAQRELKQLRNKLRNFKNKEDNAKKERVALREIMKKHQIAIKEEKKKYKALQKEVDKMAALMKDVSDDEEEEEEEESEEEVEEEEESSEESETEESEDDSDSERSQSEPEDAPIEKKRENLSVRVTRHEKILAALKKGNLMMKTNAERLQDDLNKQKELTAGLQEDLDSVLAELG